MQLLGGSGAGSGVASGAAGSREVQGVRRLGSRWFRVTAQVPAHPRYTKTVVPIGIPFCVSFFQMSESCISF